MRTEPITLLFGDDLHAVLLTPTQRVYIHDVHDGRQANDPLSGVFRAVFVEDEVAGAENTPEVFPLADPVFRAEGVEPALPDYAVGVLLVGGGVCCGGDAELAGCAVVVDGRTVAWEVLHSEGLYRCAVDTLDVVVGEVGVGGEFVPGEA